MKALGIWLLVAVAVAGTGSAAYHGYLKANPRLVLIVADSSFEMRPALAAARRSAEQLAERRYARFALYTEKARVHGWSERLEAARLNAYAPRRFERLFKGDLGPEFAEAEAIYLITNAPDAQTSGAPGNWQILRVGS